MKVIQGRRFSVRAGLGETILEHVAKSFPLSSFVDREGLYRAIGGLDGSTTLQAVAKLRPLYIGKYYMLQSDAFQIQVDRDYPRSGLHQFSVFGLVRFGDFSGPVNVYCTSAEAVPPLGNTAIFGKITGFDIGESVVGKLRLSPWLTQRVKTMFAVRCEILDRQDHFSAF